MSSILDILSVIVVPISVAFITTVGAIFANRFRKENTAQHLEGKSINEENQSLLQHLSSQVTGIDGKVDRLDERLDNVQIWQVEHEKTHLLKED
jgi:peptidoglycan hydrolase CwlO-like protein